MDAHFAAFEADLPSLIIDVVSTAFDTKFSTQLDSHILTYFEQFWHKLKHELTYRKEGEGSSDILSPIIMYFLIWNQFMNY